MYIFFPAPSIAITAAKIPAHLTMDLIYALDRMYQPGGVFGHGISPGLSGGGGPGTGIPTSTDPPLSLEQVGEMIAGVPVGGGSSGSLASRRRRGRRRSLCKPGYRWNGHRCVPKY